MGGIEEMIPAFSMWKTFNDTIPALTNMKYSESNVKKLANVIKSDQFSGILVYHHNPSFSFEESNAMNDRYKAFTVWLLGRFFYLLSREKLAGIHDLIIDAQIRILDYVSNRLPHIYNDLIEEYTEVSKQMVKVFSTEDEKMILKSFVPEVPHDLEGLLDLSPIFVEITSKESFDSMQVNMFRFIDYVLSKNITLYTLNNVVYDNIDCLISVLAESSLEAKLSAFQIYINLLQKLQLTKKNFNEKLIDKLDLFPAYLETLFYDIYNYKIPKNEKFWITFNEILLAFFKNSRNAPQVKRRSERMLLFLLSHIDSHKLVSEASFELSTREGIVAKMPKLNIKELLLSTPKIVAVFKGEIMLEIKLSLSRQKDANNLCVYDENTSKTFHLIRSYLVLHLQETACSESCKLEQILELIGVVLKMITEIKIELQYHSLAGSPCSSKIPLTFFEEEHFILVFLMSVNNHIQNCNANLPFEKFLKVIAQMPVALSNNNADTLFYLLACPFFKRINCEMPDFQSAAFDSDVKQNVRKLSRFLNFTENLAMEYACLFVRFSASGLVEFESGEESLKSNFLKFLNYCIEEANIGAEKTIATYLPDIASFCPDANLKTIRNLQTLMSRQDVLIKKTLATSMRNALCVLSSSNYIKFIRFLDDQLEITINCLSCEFQLENEMVEEVCKIMKRRCIENYAIFGVRHHKRNDNFVNLIYQTYMLWLKNDCDKETKIHCVKALRMISNHMPCFYANDVEVWLNSIQNDEKDVRNTFTSVAYYIFKNMLESSSLTKERKQEMMTIAFKYLKTEVKKSIQFSNDSLQETLTETLDKISSVKHDSVPLPTMKLLLYYIVLPFSRYSWISLNSFMELARTHNTTTGEMYRKHRKELCNDMMNLCAVNQAMIGWDLSRSLEKASLLLNYCGSKDFVTQDCHYMLSFLVPLVVIMPKVSELVEEVSTLVGLELSELLANRYGNIFLQVLLHDTDDVFHKSMVYLEKSTGLSGQVLRKRNFKIILNELLLNFSEKLDRVLLALKLLAQEDSETHSMDIQQIPDYLQPKFLGVLQYFDIKLICKDSNKTKVLCSLSSIFKFMGSKRITPLRFKIIAMLRTALNLNYGDFPQLNCEVWDSFIRSCEIEALGPQLATIFISLLPLAEKHRQQINAIYRHLIIENERLLKDNIPDLFFALDYDVDNEVLLVIRKHMACIETSSFAEQLKTFLKYLTHETIDIKICAFKYMKKLLEKNREELDQMILGYNGMDPIIVELVDTLTLGCREKDAALKLACGECFGELGAIEPSNLPRQEKQEVQSFPFFITEDTFIVNSLNELIRALHAEKNTQNMDRFALAIQDTLKLYDISSEPTSMRHNLWISFPEAQQELMRPYLSSRYTMVQPAESTSMSPIYGSSLGGSFQSWLQNWLCCLITTVKNDKKTLLQVCLPSLKQDHRLLMQFLPYILLHSLLEGSEQDKKKAYDEVTAVVNSFNAKQELDPNIMNIRPLRSEHSAFSSKPIMPEEQKRIQCTKVVFVLLDFMDRWLREWEWKKRTVGRDDENYRTVQTFLSKFDKLQLSKCNYQCGEYSRALLYVEDYIEKNPVYLNNHLYFLAEIYAQLGEADGVAGATACISNEPSLEERILGLEVSGKLADAAACYELLEKPLKLHHLQGLVQCYLDLDNVNTAYNLALEWESQEIQAEPLWRLCRYDDLDTLLKKPEIKKNTSWGVQMGNALLNFRNGKRLEFGNVLNALRSQQVDLFGASSLEEGAYQHGYNCIAKLHALNELEQVEKVVYELLIFSHDSKACESIIKKLITELELRLKVVEPSIKITEPILCLRRVAISQAKRLVRNKAPHAIPLLNSLLGESWLLSAKTARIAGFHQQTYSYTIKAEEYAPPQLFLEKAKLHWLRQDHEQALTTLKRGFERFILETQGISSSKSTAFAHLSLEQRKICAEAKLLIAKYNDSISNVDTEVNIEHYKEAIHMLKECEKSLVSLAQYFDRIFQTFSDEDRDAKGSDMQIHMINYFGKSLQYGSTYVYQSMPRLLSIWFDYGTRLLEVTPNSVKEERKNNLLKMTKLIDTYLQRLPPFMFLTCFSQLVSRICHPQKEVYIELKSIIVKLMLHYPQQTMWMMISVIKSGYAVRAKRCAEILSDSRLKTPNMIKLVGDFTNLAEKLIELCNKNISDNVSVASVSSLLRSLPRLLTKSDFSQIMIPTQKFRKLVLPNPDFVSSQHNPFPNHYVHIVGIEDEITILASLQRPRKITFKGSDGERYIQMLKPKDDLRKDFRLMEFNDIVNQLLSKEPESRQRRLNIRLYSVAPLNEECGLIEWIPNLVGLRPILMNVYKQRGLGMSGKELKESCCNIRDPLVKKREIFTKRILPRHPPVLPEWFKKNFPDAQGWFTARTAYIRTTAAMSMVGYILGLGDRHGENILFDSTCGDAVHVDFNCLFNKGETFEWPERVPFRLTQNMVAAMGPLGTEGTFRISCACTLRALRNNIATLMSIVRPFVYDPLVSWPRNAPGAASSHNAERTNEQAVEHIRNIELRLQGMIKTRGRSFSIPLSVEGQANHLINEAASVDNLCQMYIGWGPYL